MATKTVAHTSVRRARKKNTASQQTARTSRSSHLSHHQRKCAICRHPDREIIEEMFIHWQSPMRIYSRFMLRDRSTIYDHAHATGLFAKRRRNMRYALENIIERAAECDISSNGIVAAVKAYASLTTSGEWIEPARRIIYTSVSAAPAAASHGAPRYEVSNPFATRPANKNGRSVYMAPDDPALTGDGWYTRNEKQPASYSAPQPPHPSYSDGVPYSAPSAAHYRNPQPAPTPPSTASPVTTSTTPSASSSAASTVNASASAANSPITRASVASSSAPVAPHAPQTTTHASPSPAQTTTTATPTNPKCASPTNGRKITPQPANSNRYTAGLKTPATRTKQSPAPHPNRYK